MIIAVASGKGGTGKTLVATSLAISLKDRERVQFLDCDVEEPNAHIFLKPVISHSEPVSILVPEVDTKKCTYCGKCAEVCVYHAIAVLKRHVLVFSQLCHGCGACSYLCPEKAISEEGRNMGIVEWGHSDGVEFVHGKLTVGEAMPSPVIKKVKEKANREGVVIVDVSPGTSCPVVESIRGSDFCLLVTEPTPFGLNDLILAVETVRKLGIPCGVVLNRAGVGDRKVEQYCMEENIPVMLTIPLNSGIARLYSKGITLVKGLPNWKKDFVGLFDSIGEIVSEGTCSFKR
ncbi:MAG: (4Fe-4S)-binding protein [Chloroflexi bacterium]|nr:(4Fe-4S)-binding protein [Chloroflexota bacterium]